MKQKIHYLKGAKSSCNLHIVQGIYKDAKDFKIVLTKNENEVSCGSCKRIIERRKNDLKYLGN